MRETRQGPGDGEHPFGDAEPARDAALGALIAGVAGAPPFGDVDWDALGQRIASARARQRTAWWSYAARWERRAIPVALAAGLAGVLALWGLGMPAASRTGTVAMATDPVVAVMEGTPAADAARSYAHSLTASDELSPVEAY